MKSDLWFKRKTYGWGWVPATWQGWLVTLAYIVLLVVFGLTIDEQSSTREVMFTFILPVALLTIALLRIAYKKGEKPRWSWGNARTNLSAKHIALLEVPSEKFVELAVRRMGGDPGMYRDHPQEDFLLISKKYPIYVVADGVTLIQYIFDKKPYPNPSPAGDVARIFCEAFVHAAESRYETFTSTDLKTCFAEANAAVGEYNRQHGRTKETLDHWDTDLYAATAAFAVTKDNTVFWGSICDSYVVHIDAKSSVKFTSPNCDSLKQAEAPKFLGNPSDRKAKTIYTWSTIRNGLNEKGERIGYGVATGEETAWRYVSAGQFSVASGDSVVLITDGFEEYLHVPQFASLIGQWSKDLESQIKNISQAKAHEDPDKYGHERSIIAVRI